MKRLPDNETVLFGLERTSYNGGGVRSIVLGLATNQGRRQPPQCPCYMSILHVPAAYLCCLSMQLIRAVCPCCGSMLPDYAYMLFIVLVIGLFSGALANGLQK